MLDKPHINLSSTACLYRKAFFQSFASAFLKVYQQKLHNKKTKQQTRKEVRTPEHMHKQKEHVSFFFAYNVVAENAGDITSTNTRQSTDHNSL